MPRSDEEIVTLLKQTRDSLIERRLDVVAQPKPSYNIDGQEFKWTEYLAQLDKSIKSVQDEIDKAEGPYELETVAWM